MKTSTAATLSFAVVFWSSCFFATTNAATKNLRSTTTTTLTNPNKEHIRPVDRNLQNKVDDADPRIVNGWDAIDGEHPEFVRWGGCGGSLIAPRWVLTAGHCGGQTGSDVRVGAYSQTGSDGLAGTIRSKMFHPSYQDLSYDFLLLELEDSVDSNAFATLNQDGNVPTAGEELEVIGLGRLNYSPGDKPNVLQEVLVPNHDVSYCNGAYGGFKEETMFCAGNTTYDSCVGDSGGPIFTQSGIQVGLTSFGDDCAKEGKPGVYSRISFAYDWIYQTVCVENGETGGLCAGGASPSTPAPTRNPTGSPTPPPTTNPTAMPTPPPTNVPTAMPTPPPTTPPTFPPTVPPTVTPTPPPTVTVTPPPTAQNVQFTPATPPPTTATVSTPTTPAPTQPYNYDCGDATVDFPIASAPQITSCQYLATNLNSIGYMCDFVDVAISCRQTCGLCTLLDMFYENNNNS